MASPKLIALLITASLTCTGLYYGVLKPEGYTLNTIELPKFFESKTTAKTTESKTISKTYKKSNAKGTPKIVDSLNGVDIYHNGKETNVYGRNVTADGYNLGLKYQCVEFVKRYYYEYFNHKMPNSYGHAKEFFDYSLSDGSYNKARGLMQYSNPSNSRPNTGDLIVFGPTPGNQYGHVAIISQVGSDFIEIAQQNGGPNNPTRINIQLGQESSGRWQIYGKHILGFLRK
jgi:surface antigen